MAYVITEPCLATCDTACVETCPVDCIDGPVAPRILSGLPEAQRPAGVQLFIDPSSCIHCGVCAPACPVDAIFDEDEVPEEWSAYKEKNAAFFRR